MSQAQRDYEGNYNINGKKYKSITTVIKEECSHMALDVWKERTPNWPMIGRKARIYGTLMHLQFQQRLSDIRMDLPCEIEYEDWAEDPDICAELEGRMEQWLKLDIKMEKTNLMEHTIVIERHDDKGDVQSAGTLDYYGPADGMMTLLDWKSSKRPQKSHKIQLSAYYLGLIAEGRKVDFGIIAYVRKGSAELVEMTPEEMQDGGEKFLDLARKSYIKVNAK